MFEEFDDELDLLEEEKDESPSISSDDSSKRITLNEVILINLSLFEIPNIV